MGVAECYNHPIPVVNSCTYLARTMRMAFTTSRRHTTGSDDPFSPFLRLENVSKSYLEGSRNRVVLEGANASFEKGEFAAILGKSGTGKSTLLNILAGIDKANSGSLWLDGTNLSVMPERERTLFRRENIGFIFQFFNLISTLSVLENITLPLELTGISPALAKEKAMPLLEAVGLADRRGAFPDRLSGGEQQRVAIARALIHEPLLVLADEPTGNLDETTGRQVLDLLDKLTRNSGNNLIMVTHSSDASKYADRVLTLHAGLLEVSHG